MADLRKLSLIAATFLVTICVPQSARASARLSAFYGPPTPVKGLGDEAYFDVQHALHVRKGKVRFYINLSPLETFTPAKQKQITDLATAVAGRL